MRRLAHYDYWQDKLLPSILTQSGADLLVYGMGEKPFRDILSLLGRGVPFTSLKTIPQTAFLWQSDAPLPKNKHWEDLELPSYETCREDKRPLPRLPESSRYSPTVCMPPDSPNAPGSRPSWSILPTRP